MSHFSVLVVTDERPDDDAFARILAPWHEFECTGLDNEYVQDVDKTFEALQAFEAATVVRLRGPDGTLHDRFDENGAWKPEFSQECDRYRREEFVPPGYERLEIPAKQVESAAEWISDYYGFGISGKSPADKLKYGFIELDASGNVVRCVDRTNPNARWDWYQLGGRYSGRLLPKKGRDETVAVGKRSWTNEDREITGFDVCQICDLDLEAMQAQRSNDRQEWIDDIVTKSGRTRAEVDAAILMKAPLHAEWLALEPRPRGDEYQEWLKAKGSDGALYADVSRAVWELPDVPAGMTVSEWIAAAPAITSFAVVKDGQWFENGKMGWWGVVHDKKDNWEQQFVGLFASLRPDQFVSIVDCHI